MLSRNQRYQISLTSPHSLKSTPQQGTQEEEIRDASCDN